MLNLQLISLTLRFLKMLTSSRRLAFKPRTRSSSLSLDSAICWLESLKAENSSCKMQKLTPHCPNRPIESLGWSSFQPATTCMNLSRVAWCACCRLAYTTIQKNKQIQQNFEQGMVVACSLATCWDCTTGDSQSGTRCRQKEVLSEKAFHWRKKEGWRVRREREIYLQSSVPFTYSIYFFSMLLDHMSWRLLWLSSVSSQALKSAF